MKMFTSINDVNTNILLELPLHDLENFCFSSRERNNLCHQDERLQQKMKNV